MEVQRDAVEGRLDRVGRLEHDRFRGGAEGPFLHRTQRYPRVDMIELVGHDVEVPCADGSHRRYRSFDTAASTSALPAVAEAVTDFLPWYSSVHRGAGFKSQRATQAYELARRAALRFAGRDEDGEDVAVLCRNTTEAINHIAYRLRLEPDDVVVTTVVEHHANLLPWGRVARRRYVDCGVDGTFTTDDVVAQLGDGVKLLAITGASNVSGWMPPLATIIDAAHERGVPVLVDAAQLAPHHPLPADADFVAWSGHKMYAPFGASAFVGPRTVFADGDPFLAGGGAVDHVDLDEVVWNDPPEREEAGSPNVVGAVALHAAIDELRRIGWDTIGEHERRIGDRLRTGLAGIDGVRLLGPSIDTPTLALATFTVTGVPHALVAARLSAEYGIGVRHGCFCAHPYLLRLLGLTDDEVRRYRADVLRGDRRDIPGAVRASAGIDTTEDDVDALLDAVAEIARGERSPVDYEQDLPTGDWYPVGALPGWSDLDRNLGSSCARG
jgi:selenocysteine lyase/cysteine desulfurase